MGVAIMMTPGPDGRNFGKQTNITPGLRSCGSCFEFISFSALISQRGLNDEVFHAKMPRLRSRVWQQRLPRALAPASSPPSPAMVAGDQLRQRSTE